MEIEFSLSPEDITAFNQYHFKNSPAAQRSYRMGYVWGLVAAVVLFVIFQGWANVWNALFPVLFLILFLVLYPVTTRRSINQLGQNVMKEGKNKGIWGKHHITMDQKELLASTEVGESRILWSGVERVVETDRHIFIYTSSTSAHVIPRRAFADETHAHEFYLRAREYCGQN